MSDKPTCDNRDSATDSAKTRRANETDQQYQERMAVTRRMCRIRSKVIVLSGKGGVGKSTVAVNLAVAAARAGLKTGLLDVDVHGPSVPRLLGLESAQVGASGQTLSPVPAMPNLTVMSIGFLLPKRDDAVIWRGPMKYGVIRQFLSEVDWGDLDLLVVDSPPGTGDEPLSVIQLVEDARGAVIVTTPQEVAVADVRRSITFCRQLKLPVLGVVENMSGFRCPSCGEVTALFGTGGGERMAAEMTVPFLGRIPLDRRIAESGDAGRPHLLEDEPLGLDVFKKLLQCMDSERGARTMRYAVPLTDGVLSAHFGHCQEFALVDVDADSGTVTQVERAQPPPHEPGALPAWLAEKGAGVIIAGGMGQRAQNLFQESGIKVVVGATPGSPEELVQAHLAGRLNTGENICDH